MSNVVPAPIILTAHDGTLQRATSQITRPQIAAKTGVTAQGKKGRSLTSFDFNPALNSGIAISVKEHRNMAESARNSAAA